MVHTEFIMFLDCSCNGNILYLVNRIRVSVSIEALLYMQRMIVLRVGGRHVISGCLVPSSHFMSYVVGSFFRQM